MPVKAHADVYPPAVNRVQSEDAIVAVSVTSLLNRFRYIYPLA
jgi:hypothetical protein